MNIGLYTSARYIEMKKAAVNEVAQKLGIDATIIHDETLERPVSTEQAFGFEELFQRAKFYAQKAVEHDGIDVGVGIENSLSFIYSANEWYYVLCVALHTKENAISTSFTTGVNVPEWMVKNVQENKIKIDALTQSLAGEEDPVIYLSSNTLTRKDLMIQPLLLAFSKLDLEKHRT